MLDTVGTVSLVHRINRQLPLFLKIKWMKEWLCELVPQTPDRKKPGSVKSGLKSWAKGHVIQTRLDEGWWKGTDLTKNSICSRSFFARCSSHLSHLCLTLALNSCNYWALKILSRSITQVKFLQGLACSDDIVPLIHWLTCTLINLQNTPGSAKYQDFKLPPATQKKSGEIPLCQNHGFQAPGKKIIENWS